MTYFYKLHVTKSWKKYMYILKIYITYYFRKLKNILEMLLDTVLKLSKIGLMLLTS